MVGDRKGRGVIQKSDSNWMSPAVLVQKDGGLQVCVEYQRLNDNSEDCFVLLQIDDTLDTLIGVKWFSTFDLKNGYWQVLLQPDDKENMVISIGDVLWQFTVLPFSLGNAPATFKQLVHWVL